MTKSSTIQNCVLNYLSDNQEHSVQEIKNYLQSQGLTDYTEGQFAGSINTLLRNNSIKKIDRGVYSIKLRSENMKKCFVVSPIGEDNSDIRKRADQVYKYIIEPACQETEFEPIRVDKLNQPDSITQTIIDYLSKSDLVIADISGHNPNVFYEMGYRFSTGKPIIHLKEKKEVIPFDIAGIRAFDYNLSDLDAVEEVKTRLIKTINSLTFDEPDVNSQEQDKDIHGDVSQMMSILFGIQDEIMQLKKEIHGREEGTIQAVVKALAPSRPIEDTNTELMKAILPELLKKPDYMKSLIELNKMINNK